jgi:NAD(P)-dependent dehydrogenase (short-subunit alcohol dehydrogenase family)
MGRILLISLGSIGQRHLRNTRDLLPDADAIVYLLSPQAKYITGHNLVVDGAWTAW